MAMEFLTLSTEEIRGLEEEAIILDAPQNGKRKVSAALLSLPSNGRQIPTSSSPSASVHYRALARTAPFDLPETLESAAAYEFLGFTKETAVKIFARWAARPGGDKNPEGGILEYALGHIGMSLRNLQPAQAMSILGISEELQNVLMDPQFKKIFESETLCYWLNDTIASRFWTLLKLLGRLKNHAVLTTTQQLPATTSTEDELLPQALVTRSTTGEILPDHIVLYKCKGVSESTEREPDPLIIPGTGDINMDSLKSFAGGDFNQAQGAWYWTPEEATAEQYRLWASRRNLHGETWIVRIQVPQTFFIKLRQEELWFSPDWKEYIWYCKQRLRVGYPPAKFDKYWKSPADIIKGHIAARHPSRYPIIDKADIETKINEDDILTNGNKKSTQWVVMNKDTADRMAVEIRGKIHVEVYPAAL